MNKAFIFPGQGSQIIGMGKEFAESFQTAKEIFEEVDEALSHNLSRIIFEGPLEELTLTANTQPALMAVSMAIVGVMEKDLKYSIKDNCKFLAGHSLGEYSALVAASAFSISDAAKLLRIRGDSMQKAAPVGTASMAALLGVDISDANNITKDAAEGEICQIANDNCPGQIVISGNIAAIERAISIAASLGKKAIKLPVSAAFHSGLMLPAQDAMKQALDEAKISRAMVPVIANISALPIVNVDDIRCSLVEQVTGMVRWRESVLYMKDNGVLEIIEIGAGKVLSGLNKRIVPDIKAVNIQTPHDLDEFAKNM